MSHRRDGLEPERENSVANSNPLDPTDNEIDATLVEVHKEDNFGKDTFFITYPQDEIFYPNGLLTIHDYNRNVHAFVEFPGEVSTRDALASFKSVGPLKVKDAANKDELFTLIPTEEKVKDKLDDSLSLDHESVSFLVNGAWEEQ